jgi:nucleoside-diphosphate-sugar epimerase
MTNPSIHPVIREDLSEIHSSQLDWERFRSKTVLVTGGGGCLPSSMIEALLWMNSKCGLDCRIICLVRNLGKAKLRFSAYSGRPDLCFVVGDVADGVPIDSRCDFVIHAASQASPRFYGSDPVGTMAANLLGTHHLLKLAREWSSESFLFFSSGEVYGEVDPGKIPICESSYGYIDILNPRSCYAESKRAAETLAASFVHQYGVPCVIVRPFHTYGPGMSLDDGRVYADFVNDIVHSRNIVLRSDGSAVRAFCYLGDAVRAFFTILLNGTPGVAYNSGNPSAKSSISELADTLVALFPERNLTVERVGAPAAGYLASPVASSVPDVSALAALGWQPCYSIAEGFLRTVRYYMDQR